MWVGRQSRRFLCLFWRETRQRILGHEISPYPEVVRGREWGVDGGPGREQLALDSREASRESWRGITDRSSQHWTPETVGDKMGSSEEDESRWRHSSCFVEFSLVTHASVSPYMLSRMQSVAYLPLLLVNPKLCSCLFVCPIFSVPSIVFLWWQEMCVTPSNH